MNPTASQSPAFVRWFGLVLFTTVLVRAIFGAPQAPSRPLPPVKGLVVSLVRNWDGRFPEGFLDEPGTALAPGRDWDNAVRYGERHPSPRGSDWATALTSAGVAVQTDSPEAASWAGVGDAGASGAGPHESSPRCIVAVQDTWETSEPPPGWGMIQIPMQVPNTARWVPVRIQIPGSQQGPDVSQAFWRPWSPSTRRSGFIAATDIGSTLCAMLGAETRVGSGRAVRQIPDNTQSLQQWWETLRVQDSGFTLRWAVPVVAGILVLAVIFGRRPALEWAVIVGIATVIWTPVVLAWLPEGLGKLAGYQTDLKLRPVLPYGCALLAAVAVMLSGKRTASWHPWGPDLLHGLLTADALLGFPSQTTSPLGYGLAEAARFHGIGNETAGLWIGVVTWSMRYGYHAAAMRSITAAIAIGAPGWGANVGCGLAAICAAAAFLIVSIPVQRRRFVAIATTLVAVLAIFGLAWRDARRPPEQRSHLGNLVGRWAGGDTDTVREMMVRKIGMNVRLAGTSRWMVLLVPTALWFAWLWRTRRLPGVVAAGPGVALLANDSGVVAAAMACAAILPMLRQAKEKTAPDESPGRLSK